EKKAGKPRYTISQNSQKIMKQIVVKYGLVDILYVVAGILCCGFALKGFLIPNHFFDGGVTGISLLLHEIYHWNIGYVIVLANLPLIIMAWLMVSKRFALRMLAAIVGLALCLLFIPYPQVTSDK